MNNNIDIEKLANSNIKVIGDKFDISEATKNNLRAFGEAYHQAKCEQAEAVAYPEDDREAVIAFMNANFSDRTFTDYIRTKLAGDFAYQLANALRKFPDQSAELERLKAQSEKMLALIKNDAYAISFQSMAQYRTALIKEMEGVS